MVGLFSLVTCYLIVLMYAQGEYLFAILTLIRSAPGFTSSPTAAPMPGAMYPGVAGMGLFVMFPLICTIAIAFTNTAAPTS